LRRALEEIVIYASREPDWYVAAIRNKAEVALAISTGEAKTGGDHE
jgi:hypothetical protein